MGLEWQKDLGDVERGTGRGADVLAPILGIGWVPTETDFVITLVQYFQSYRTEGGVAEMQDVGPRLIWIRKLPAIGGWTKVDYKAVIDAKADGEFSSTLELQLGKMFTPRIGVYGEPLVGNAVLHTDAYDAGVGAALRVLY